MKTFGNSVGRLEDPNLLTGQACFADDILLEDELQAAFVRSPHGHAAIKKIDCTEALALDGVHAIFTATDFAPHLNVDRLVVGLPSPSYKQDLNRPILAQSETVHVGEAIVLIVAKNRYIAEDAAALVDIDFAPLTAVGDCRASLAPGSSLVHTDTPHNLLAEFDVDYGDVSSAFGDAPHVFTETIWQHRGGAHSIECRGTLARYDSFEDLLTVWSSTQTPHTARQLLCEILGREENQIRVITPDVGGGFGPKLIFYPEDAAVALAAMMLKRPVKWIEDRREHFIASTQERDQYWEVEIAVNADASIRGIRGTLIHEHGAYTARGVNLPYESAQTVTLPYEVPAYSLNVKLALTNKVPVTPVRGAGQPQGTFVMERLLDRVAGELNLDRAEVRRRNLIAAEKMPYTKPLKSRGGMQVVLDSGDYPECQKMVLEASNWEEFAARKARALSEGKYIGLGLANFVKGTGRGPFEPVTVRVSGSGKIFVNTGAAAMGQSTKTMLAQIVSDQLGGTLENVIVSAGDTGTISMGLGGFNSRQAVMAGSSAHLAGLKLREKILSVGAQLLDTNIDQLEFELDTISIKGATQKKVKLGDIARMLGGTPGFALPEGISPGMEVTESFVCNEMAYANGAAVAEVEVDVETGGVTVKKIIIAHDCGRVINPMLVDGQIVGGVVHGLGNALFEWMGFDENCQPLTTTFADYLLVSATEVPPIEVLHMESPSPLNPLGVKGVGECGVLPIAPAIMSAIEDAMSPFGAHIARAPIHPSEIVEMAQAGRRP